METPSRLPPAFRGDLRRFAFQLANGTVDVLGFGGRDYGSELTRGDTLAVVFTVFANHVDVAEYGAEAQPSVGRAHRRAAAVLRSRCDRDFTLPEPLARWETDPGHHPDYRADLGRFAGRLSALVQEFDRVGIGARDVCTWGSGLEQVFALWANVVELDGAGRVRNFDSCQRRVEQLLTEYADEDYEAEPPFAEWELELW